MTTIGAAETNGVKDGAATGGLTVGAGEGEAAAISTRDEQRISTAKARRTNILSAVGNLSDERAKRVVRLVRALDHCQVAGAVEYSRRGARHPVGQRAANFGGVSTSASPVRASRGTAISPRRSMASNASQ